MAGKLFFVEFDRNLQSLIHLPEFKTVKGIVLGRAQVAAEMNREKWTKLIKGKPELNNIPVIAGADFGHSTPRIDFPIGGTAKIKAENGEIKLLIKG